jgi:citrate lyase beta subunit
MRLRLIYLTKDPAIGMMAEQAGVDWIFVDLEYRGKSERQVGRNTVISAHTINDIVKMNRVLKSSKLLVRINPIGIWSQKEINDVISSGADILMLPFFKSSEEVKRFLELNNGRAKTCLLLETMDAIQHIDEILNLDGIDYIHVGLNDLHIERKTKFMFEFVADGSMDSLAMKFKNKQITFGFGGCARIGDLVPPAERVIAEHYRLGSSGVILSRSFLHPSQINYSDNSLELFIKGVSEIRNLENELSKKDLVFFEKNKIIFQNEVKQVVTSIMEL